MTSTSTPVFAGSIPTNYERYLGPMLFEPFALDLAKRLKEEQLKTVLELACGTGRVTKHLIPLLNENGKLFATDLNPDMIEVARTKVGDSRIVWQVVDAQELPYQDEQFDHVICQFGVMFLPDKLKALKEACRVLQNGGRLLFNTWDDLAHNEHSFLIQRVLCDIMKENAPDFLEKGPFSMYDQKATHDLVKAAGFEKIHIETVSKTATFESIDNIVKGYLEGSPLAAFINKLDEQLQTTIKQRVTEEVINTYGKDNHHFPMQAILCSAYK